MGAGMKSFIRFVLVFFVIVLSSNSYAFQSKAIKKATDYMSAGMKREAIEALEYGIMERPKDHEAHWMLGKLYLEGDSYYSADERFKSAVLLKPSYKSKLGSLYKTVGMSKLNEVKPDEGVSLLNKAINLNPNFKKEILEESFDSGKKYILIGKPKKVDRLFNFIISKDRTFADDICEFLVSTGDKLSKTRDKVCFYQKAIKYNPSVDNRTIGLKIAKIAVNEWPSKDAKRYKKIAGGILDKDTMDQIFPGETIKTKTLGPFTKADVNDKGYVTVLETGRGIVEIGDKVEVIATVMDGSPYFGNKVLIAADGQWVPLKDGYDQSWIGNVNSGIHILINEKGNVEFIVKISRKYQPGPNKSFFKDV